MSLRSHPNGASLGLQRGFTIKGNTGTPRDEIMTGLHRERKQKHTENAEKMTIFGVVWDASG
jgi:hypothetical protein